MRRSTKLKFVAGSLAVGMFASTVPASAGSDGTSTKRVLAAVGSDTTTFVLDALAAAYNISPANPDSDKVVNVPPLHSIARLSQAAETAPARAWLAAARRSWPGGVVVPADDDCKVQRVYGGEGSLDLNGNGNYADAGDKFFTPVDVDADNNGTAGETGKVGEVVQIGWVAPNGSGSGQTFASNYSLNPVGCVDLARSSSAPSNPALWDAWSFALDAIGWVYFPGNNHGVTALSRETLNQIYTCDPSTPTVPKISQWGQIPGANPADTTPIKPYRVQVGSGTGNDVAGTLIGVGSNAANVGQGCDAALVPTMFPTVQEHDCTGVSDVDKPDAICFYGYSRWRIQSRALEPDKRNGARFGAFYTGTNTPRRPTPSTINDTADRYEGSRRVYTLIPKGPGGTPLPSFGDALDFTGVVPSTGIDWNADTDFTDPGDVPAPAGGQPKRGFVCNGGQAQTIIRTYGFVPYKLGNTDLVDAAYGQSFCRRNVPAL